MTPDPTSDFCADEIKRVAKEFAATSKEYRPNWARSVMQLAVTSLLFCASLFLMYGTLGVGFWLTLVLAVPTAGLLVRLFIVQHDCGHGSFFPSRAVNDAVGRTLGLLTFTPYAAWQRDHARHHATTGDLDARGHGDVTTLTIGEYRLLPPVKRLGYRLYRNPLIMVLLGAPVNFILLQRFAIGQSLRNRSAWRSILLLNIALAVAFGTAVAVIGILPVMAIYLPVLVIASWVGNWLFYVQHQFEGAYWQRKEEWAFHAAALCGGSHFELPPILQWFSGNVGLHHVHHLCSRIPNYQLQACLDAHPQLQRFTRKIRLGESLRCWRLALWDEQQGKLVGFHEA